MLMETAKIMELEISYVTAILDEQGCSVVKVRCNTLLSL